MIESVATLTSGHNERNLTNDLPVVVILGATATGKSGLALHLAAHVDAEIISSDSRYLYLGMDIGTAKPSADELRLVPHHLVDILQPEDDYSLAGYLDDAFAAIEDAGHRGKLPIVAGGTPLYLRALMQGWLVPRVPPDPSLRAELDQKNPEDLHESLSRVDPVSAERIGPRNKRRLIRALEVFRGAGIPLSELEGNSPPPYRLLVLGLYQEREDLYRKIDERVAWMFGNGLLDEARMLLDRGVPDDAPAMSAIGYREARAVMSGEISIEDAIERTCNATHRYVRHQDTWFKRFDDIHWLNSGEAGYQDRAVALVNDFLKIQVSVTG